MLSGCLEALLTNGIITDAALAQSEAQAQQIRHYREEIPEAQKRHGPQLKHDISVPVSKLAPFLEDAARELTRLLPGVIVNAFGHLGDGNVHLNLSPPADRSDFSGKENALSDAIYRLAEDRSGSFAAEHGVGRTKGNVANTLRSHAERSAMAAIKSALDPNGIMNPGCIFQS